MSTSHGSAASQRADKFTLADPRVHELDRAASEAYVTLCEAIEKAARQGVPPEVIARYTDKPMADVRMIITEMQDPETRD